MARILIIDDENLALFTLREILEEHGHDITEASDGEQGLALQAASPFDLVVTDTIMPRKTGLDVIRELKRDFPDLKIICVSGSARSSNIDLLVKAKEYGADEAIGKPFTEDQLIAAVNRLLTEAA